MTCQWQRGVEAGGDAARLMRQREDALVIRQEILNIVRELIQNDESRPDPKD